MTALDETGVLAVQRCRKRRANHRPLRNILSKAEREIDHVCRDSRRRRRAGGVRAFDHKELREWSEADIALAKAVADQTGIAIRQAELYQKAEATSMREALVNRLTMAIRASLSLPEVLSTATRELGRALSASRVHLYLYRQRRGQFAT